MLTVTTNTGRYEAAATGEAKVGRWTYPAIRTADGQWLRNEKTDGSRSYVPVDASKVTGIVEQGAPKAKASKKAAPARQKLTWELGTKCPKGHLLTEETRYAMPSGRVQCRECRAENRSKKA